MKRLAVFAALAVTLAVANHAALAADATFAAPDVPGVRGEILRSFDAAASKLVQLGEAIPADKYGWRPAEGVRSVSEVLLHAAGANYLFMSFVGVAAPADFDSKTFETSTVKKDEVLERLKKSIAHVKAGVAAMKDSDLDTKAKWFVGESPKREILIVLASHDHEHLGQLIAYARMNGVTPPWSKKE